MFRSSAERFTGAVIITLLSCYISVMECQNFITILPPTADVRVCTGDSITLRCRVMFNGVAVPGTWRRDGTPIYDNITLSNHFITPFNSTGQELIGLIITDVNPTDNNSVYSCTFTGLTPNSVTLHLAGQPSPVGVITTIRGCLSTIVSWDAVTSDPVCGPVSYDVTISPSDGVMMMRITDTSYNFTGLIPDNSYTVTVAGRNDASMGEVLSVSINIITTGPPSHVNIYGIDTCINDATISWDPATSDPLCGPVSYVVTISPSDGVVMMKITDTSYNFTGITPDNSYTVTVAGRNSAGVGESTMIVVNTPTVAEAVPTGLLNPRNTTNKTTSITVTWDPASSLYCGVIYYQVVISFGCQLVSDIITTELSATFHGLMGNTAYSITVVALNRAGNGITVVENLITAGNDDDDDDDDLSTGTAVTITAVVTFIITLVFTVPVTTIISIMCYKHRCEQREKSNNKNDNIQDCSQFVLTDRDVNMDTNPSYAIMDKDTIKMDTNPAYAVTK